MKTLDYCRDLLKNWTERETDQKFIAASEDIASIPWLVKNSQKFLVDGDTISFSDDNWNVRAIDVTKTLRLPFPNIAIEADLAGMYQEFGGGDKATKNIVFARETDNKEEIIITPVMHIPRTGAWIALPEISIPTTYGIQYVEGSSKPLIGWKFVNPIEGMQDVIKHMSIMRVTVLLVLLNVLSCSNIKTEKLPVSPAKRALSSHKKHPYDDYWVLTIDTTKSRSNSQTTGTGRHPREYVKRGHIRRLPSGACTWVNAHVCSKGNGGKITKDYAIK